MTVIRPAQRFILNWEIGLLVMPEMFRCSARLTPCITITRQMLYNPVRMWAGNLVLFPHVGFNLGQGQEGQYDLNDRLSQSPEHTFARRGCG